MSTSRPISPPGASSFAERALRVLALTLLYTSILAVCRYFAYELRFDFLVPETFQGERLLSVIVSLPVKLLCLLLFRQFGSLLTYFSVPDLMRIAVAMAVANLTIYLVRLGLTPGISAPRGVVLIDFVLSVGALAMMRLGFRIYRERFVPDIGVAKNKLRRVVVFGAGDAGAQFVKEAQARPSLGLRPVFFLDDDQRKHHQHLYGIPVLGSPEYLATAMEDYEVDSAVLAMPSAVGKRVQDIYRVCAAQGLKVEIVPSMAELATGRVQVTKIRPVQVEDLLGRMPVDMRSDDVTATLRDRVVMVTGAGGSIGSELCRQIAAYNPKRLLLVEQAEGSLFTIEQEMNEAGYRGLIVPLVADILDAGRMRFIFQRFKPEIVFHAAAHKHVFMMERQPSEAVKNNTTGTRMLAEAAAAHGVATFVLISTDKAINPTSVMGASKRLAEIHLQHLQAVLGNRTKFIAVRFGNVLGSSGSVIPIFKKQIAAGGPVKVTHPEVTRYFMTIPEAVGLVLHTAHLGQGGEIFVLDMGKPVKILDLAKQLIELSGLRAGEDIQIEFIGLRPGEKRYEELQHHSEMLHATVHPRILKLACAGSPPEDCSQRSREMLEDRITALEPEQIKLIIKELVPEYTPYLESA